MLWIIFNKIIGVLKSRKNKKALEWFEFSAYFKGRTISHSDRTCW